MECARRFPGLVPQNLQFIEFLMQLPDSHERENALEKLSDHLSHPVAERTKEALVRPAGNKPCANIAHCYRCGE